jgi:hypothetical protein
MLQNISNGLKAGIQAFSSGTCARLSTTGQFHKATRHEAYT